MVTPIDLEYLRSQPLFNVVEELSYETILEERIEGLRAKLPGWSASIDSPAYKIQEYESLREFVLRQLVNSKFRSSVPPFSTGSTLTALATLAGLKREEYSDDELLLLLVSNVRQAPGTENGLINLAKSTPGLNISDAAVSFNHTTRKTTVYALGENLGDLNLHQSAELVSWMNRAGHTILDWSAISGVVTRTALAISVTIFYYASQVNPALLQERVRTAIYAWIDSNSRLNNNIYQDSLQAAATVNGAKYVTVNSPANESYDSAENILYTFNKTDADDGVRIAVTAL